LLLKNRLNTRGLLKRKDMSLDSYNCELCLLQKEENLRHIFFRCPFAKKKVLEYHRDTSTNMAKTKKSNEKLKEEIEGLICYGNYHSYLCGGAYELKEMLGFFTMRTQ
jgi:septation ring formation regulator EzrA